VDRLEAENGAPLACPGSPRAVVVIWKPRTRLKASTLRNLPRAVGGVAHRRHAGEREALFSSPYTCSCVPRPHMNGHGSCAALLRVAQWRGGSASSCTAPGCSTSRKEFSARSLRPRCGHYEYAALATNKTLGGRGALAFMCGRGTHEQVYGELKSGFAFACVPTMRYAANSAWQILSVLAFNLVRGFQMTTTAARRPRTRKRRTVFRFETSTRSATSASLGLASSSTRTAMPPSMSDPHRRSSIASNASDRLLKAA